MLVVSALVLDITQYPAKNLKRKIFQKKRYMMLRKYTSLS